MRKWVWIILLFVCLGALVPVQRWLDAQRAGAAVLEDSLYITSGKTLRRMSFGYESLLADLYWLRTIQYFGGKMQELKGKVNLNDVSSWRLDLLEPLLNLTTELDPNYIAAWRFGAIFLPDIDPESGIRFVQRGIESNPQEWRLFSDLGYIYWKQKRFAEASEAYGKGAQINNAPAWLKTMQAVMLLKGGDRDTARALFQRMYDSSEDAYTRQLSLARLQSLQAEDELTLLNKLLAGYRERYGSCPSSLPALLKHLSPQLRQQMRQGGMQFAEDLAPLEPDGLAYEFDPAQCRAALNRQSAIVQWMEFK